LITITGDNFGTGAFPVSVFIGDALCANVAITKSHEQLVCSAPSGSKQNQHVLVIVDSQQNNDNNTLFSYQGITFVEE
jgi:hypothetical protein